jgi:MoaA/NifB/PqqE/SkfB family radical SAM enzyme
MRLEDNLNKYEQRLLQEWRMHGKIIIGVDFDDTISAWKFKSEDDLITISKTIELIKMAKTVGAYVVIFTACKPDRNPEIQEYCEKVKLPIDTINVTPFEIPEGYGKNGKIYANIFLDDRAGLTEALETLQKVTYIRMGDNMKNLTLGEHV